VLSPFDKASVAPVEACHELVERHKPLLEVWLKISPIEAEVSHYLLSKSAGSIASLAVGIPYSLFIQETFNFTKPLNQ